MNKWLYLLDALRKGSRLSDAESWKSAQIVSTLVVGVLVSGYAFGSAMGWLPEGYSDNTLAEIGSALGMLAYTVFSAYTTVATTTKIGIPNKPAGGGDGELREPKRSDLPPPVQTDARRAEPRNPFLD